MRLNKLTKIIAVFLLTLFCCAVYFFCSFSDEPALEIEVSIQHPVTESNKVNPVNISTQSLVKHDPKNDRAIVYNSTQSLVMTGEQLDTMMARGAENGGVTYVSIHNLNQETQKSVKDALKNLNEKGSISGGIRLKEFTDLEGARANLKSEGLATILDGLDDFKSTPDSILERQDLKLTGTQNFGRYDKTNGWNGIYKLYENNSQKVEIEQMHLKPGESTQQLILESLNYSLSNSTPAIYEKLPSDLIEKLTFVSDKNYYQINGYNLKQNDIIKIANEIIQNPNK